MEWLLVVTESDRNVAYDDLLERPKELLQVFGLHHEVVFQALGAEPLALLEHDCANHILPGVRFSMIGGEALSRTTRAPSLSET